jgi:putative ABC transport system permease protein
MSGRLARRNAMRQPGRTVATAAALTIGVALITLVTVVATGLKDSATASIDQRVTASHVVVGQDGWSPVDPKIERDLASAPGVTAVSSLRQDGAQVFGDTEMVNAIDPATAGKVLDFEWKQGAKETLADLGRDGAVVDDGWATEHGITVGERFSLKTMSGEELSLVAKGVETSPVLDVLGLGPITISQDAYDGAFAQERNRLTLVAGADIAALEKVLAAYPDAKVEATGTYADEQAAAVDQLLAIFGALLALCVIVSLFGIVNALVLATFERTRELGTLRSLGMSRRQVRRMVRHESVITALLGASGGIAIGLGLAWAVTSAFAEEGLQFAVPAGALIGFTAVAIVAGVLAAVLPARRASRIDVLTALAYE